MTPKKDVQSYRSKQFFARVELLSITHKVPLRYFAYFLDIGEGHLYHHLQGVPTWTPSDRWIKTNEKTLDQIQLMLEEYKQYSKGRSSEGKFINWLFLIYLGRTPRFLPVPEEEPDLHAEVLKLLGSRVDESRHTPRSPTHQGHINSAREPLPNPTSPH